MSCFQSPFWLIEVLEQEKFSSWEQKELLLMRQHSENTEDTNSWVKYPSSGLMFDTHKTGDHCEGVLGATKKCTEMIV